MSIHKKYNREKTSFVWEFCITIQKKPKRIQYRKSGFKTKLEAQNAESKARALFLDGEDLKSENISFRKLAEMFLAYTKKTKAKSTYINYNNSFTNHLEYFYEYKINELSSLVVEMWVCNSDKTPSTINECIKFGKAVFNYGIKHRLCKFNPFLMIEKVKTEKKKHTRLSIEEAIQLLDLCHNLYEDFYPILILALFTGLREGELLALKWSDIDYKKKTITIQRQYTNGELKNILKTSSSYRDVDITDSIIEVLHRHKQKSKILSEYIFTNTAGNLHNPRNLIQRRFENLLLKLFGNKKYMRFHDLRGTYVDILLKEGIPLKYMQKQLGHANYLTTMNNYSDLIKDVNDHAVNILDKVLKRITA